MQPFVYNALPARVIFGHGTISQVSTEIHNLGCSKALILTTPGQIKAGQTLQASLGPELAVGLFSKAILHTPVDVTEEAVQLAQTLAADCVVALGGGSTIGLGKAIALRTDLPQIVIPTTYAGSEATAVLGQTQDGIKTTQKSMKVVPEVIIYVDLTLGLSPRTTITSGINAIAHAVEALYAAEANPITDMLAEQGIQRLAKALPILFKDPQNKDARSDALYGAWACSVCAGTVGFALHHKLCHAIGGTFNLSHADTHTVLLPHTVAYNSPFTIPAMVKVIRNLGVPDGVSAAQGIYDLAKNNGAPYALKDIGMKEEDLERAVDVALKNPYPNPAPLERETMLALLRDAYEGRRPA